MAAGVPQYRRLVAGGVLADAAPALLPEPVDERGPVRGSAAGGRAPCGGGSTPLRRLGADDTGVGGVVVSGYDTVTVALRHGLEAVDILRLRRACGVVLQSRNGSTLSFFVPAGTSATWHLPGSSCTAGALLLPAADPRWVMPPAGADCGARPTDAWVLRSALCEAACTLTAGGLGPF
ncbi:hypothetical protein RMN57_14785 [Kitasatospora sp. CM 4170]|uniref:DNA primase/polymerase bifunctional N-terminal domain-containing protein n=1 Tax=Kitasatospora aburaviensis TaxID=67265 RepID=A0ABW1ERR9_9ACTN|nr:hypothetical protein [Kitasatospora sp. CM 4170]WNM45888.1 hypothetical protein RMN57_14785 [Kitasatospora sp. CM 4170]